MLKTRLSNCCSVLVAIGTGALLLTACAIAPPALLPGSYRVIGAQATGPAVVLGGRREGQGPTVVLLAGHDALGLGYAHVMARLDPARPVVWVDRPGLGWSASGQPLPAPDQSLSLMRDALAASGVPPPYLLVGHSLGGAFALRWAQRWPQDIRGLVLVSPTHPGLWDGLAPDVQRRIVSWTRNSQALPWLARVGVLSLWNPYDDLAGSLPEAERRAARFFARDATHLQALAEEAALALPESPLLAPLCVESQAALPTEWLIETEPPGDAFDAARRALAARMSAQPGLQVTEVATDHIGMLLHPQAAARVAERIEALLQRLASDPR